MSTRPEDIAAFVARKAAIVAAVQALGIASHEIIAKHIGVEPKRIKRAVENLSREKAIVWVWWRQRKAWVMPGTEPKYKALNDAWSEETRKASARARAAADRARNRKPRNGPHKAVLLACQERDANRVRILGLVTRAGDPGIASSAVERATGLGHTAVSRHLRALRDEGAIEFVSRGSASVWGLPGICKRHELPAKPARSYPQRRKKKPVTDLSPREQDTLDIICAADGGVSKSAIAAKLGVGTSSVATWCARLQGLDLVHSTRTGSGRGLESLWLAGSGSKHCGVSVPEYMACQVPSIFAFGAAMGRAMGATA